MMLWLSENLATIIIGVILAAIVVMIIVSMIKNKKKGKSSSCGCGCKDCAMSDMCHSGK